MPIETYEKTDKVFESKEAYIERFPLSDDGMYHTYKAMKKREPFQQAFIEWYESGFKPKGRPNMARFRHMMFELQRIGFPFERFCELLGNRFTDLFKLQLWRNSKIMGENAAQENYERVMSLLPEHIIARMEPYDESTYTLR